MIPLSVWTRTHNTFENSSVRKVSSSVIFMGCPFVVRSARAGLSQSVLVERACASVSCATRFRAQAKARRRGEEDGLGQVDLYPDVGVGPEIAISDFRDLDLVAALAFFAMRPGRVIERDVDDRLGTHMFDQRDFSCKGSLAAHDDGH